MSKSSDELSREATFEWIRLLALGKARLEAEASKEEEENPDNLTMALI